VGVVTDDAARQAPDYTERLWPGATVWVLAVSMIGALAIAYASAVGAVAGWIVAVVGAVGAAVLIWRSAARIVVAADGLHAGRAFLEWEFMGRVLALDAAQARTARGPEGDPSAHLLLRPGVGPGAVVLEVADPQDPHHTWLLASRHPRQLASAIEAARGRLSP
jgi:hypothetical protein